MARKTGSCRLALFKVALPNGASTTDALYANGRHQCEVLIQVVKEVVTATGEWERTALTDEEFASITLCAYSTQTDQLLPKDWHCDQQKNIYSAGLYQPEGEPQASFSYLDPQVDTVVRYLRVEEGGAQEAVAFMAVIDLEGATYTTALVSGQSSDGATVTVKPVASYGLPIDSLVAHVDTKAYEYGLTMLAVYYWVLPTGLGIVENKGIDGPVALPNEGDNFQTLEVRNYGAGSLSVKIGVVVNKDLPEALLRMDDVHKNLPISFPNPFVKFHERPTVMRAVRLISTVFPESRLGNGLWRLIDNFGREHTYFLSLASNGDIKLETRGAVESELRVTEFFVTLPGGGQSTNALYANGHHQCQVNIEVTLEQRLPGGRWERVPLTAGQRNSITLAEFSADPHQGLPEGWGCDQEKNKYNLGLWKPGSTEDLPEASAAASQQDVVARFLRVAPEHIQTQRFMASITINGKTITTNSADVAGSAVSWVIVSPVRPYLLGVDELTPYVDETAYQGSNPTVLVSVYYWTPPAGLSFFDNLGVSHPVPVSHEGYAFTTAVFSREFGPAKVGVVVGRDGMGQSIYMNDVQRNVYPDKNPRIEFNKRETIMRAIRFAGPIPGDAPSVFNDWTVRDNYGCEHRYRLGYKASGGALTLSG